MDLPKTGEHQHLIDELQAMLASNSESAVKHVYACAGLALYLANCLEMALVALLATKATHDSKSPSTAEFDRISKECASLTLGPMIRRFTDLFSPGVEVREALQNALSARNRLAHAFFIEEGDSFFSPTGKLELVKALAAMCDSLSAAEMALKPFFDHWKERMDISPDKLAWMEAKLLAEEEARHQKRPKGAE